MGIFESFRIALEAIWANKLRALLTMLGVIIGVSSVIIMIALVQGLRQSILKQLSSNGANLVFAAYDPQSDTLSHGVNGITMADIDAIERRCSLIQDVSPEVEFPVNAHNGASSKSVSIHGVMPDFPDIHQVALTDGRFVDATDAARYGKACVIGADLKTKLFGASSAVGRTLLCSFGDSTVAMTVVGVLDEKDRGGDGVDYNNGIFAPLRSVQLRFSGTDIIESFTARSKDVTLTDQSADQIWAVMKDRHPTNYKDYIVDTQAGLLKQIDVIINVLQLVLGGIAGLSLLTGGIGIMNIMLVSVTERTREIGIRKAVGATRGAILAQFIVEAMVVSGLGGLIGIGLGEACSALIDSFNHKNLPTYVPLWAIGLGFGFAVAVGLFFGIYPAFRASKLDPIQALRYE